MRTTLLPLAAACLLACGGTPRTGAGPGGPSTDPPGTGPKLAGTVQFSGEGVFGPAFSSDGASILFAVGGKLHRYDAKTLAEQEARPITAKPRLEGPAIVLRGREGGDAAIELAAAARIEVAAPAGYECEGRAFSADASWQSRTCVVKDQDGVVVVQDTRTGKVIAELIELVTAAPVRSGEITETGRFVFWSSRASGAFEEIATKVIGPVLSSHSVMSPDERVVFTVSDKNWMPDDRTLAQVIDPKTGRTLYTLPFDIDRVDFSPNSQRFAAIHRGEDREISEVTLHRTGDGSAAGKLGDRDVEIVAFSPDARSFVVRGAGALRLYTGVP